MPFSCKSICISLPQLHLENFLKLCSWLQNDLLSTYFLPQEDKLLEKASVSYAKL